MVLTFELNIKIPIHSDGRDNWFVRALISNLDFSKSFEEFHVNSWKSLQVFTDLTIGK